MLPTVLPGRRPPPGSAIAAAVLALVSCAFPLFFLLMGVAISGPDIAWVDVALPVGLTCALVAGAVLLLLGRSWLPLVVATAVLTALAVVLAVFSGGGGVGPFSLLGPGLPALSLLLTVFTDVRGWVAERRGVRAAG